MTQPNTTTTPHLNEEQFGELVSRSPQTANSSDDTRLSIAKAHLDSCPECAAELANLRESLALFREASTAYAEKELRAMPRHPTPAHRPMLQPAYWAAVAATIVVAFALPTQWHHSASAPPAVATSATNRAPESDEALLEDVNQELSEAVPTPMRALADPTATTSTLIQNSSQRKD